MKKVFATLLGLASICSFAQMTTGKISLKKGAQFVIESSSNGLINQEMMGQSMEMKMSTTTQINAAIKDSKDNQYTITQTLTKVKSTFSGMGQDKSFDSDKKEDLNGEAGALYKDQFNVPKDIVITNEGKPAITAMVAKSTEQDANPMAAVMQMMGGGQGNVATALFLVIPAGKKVGDSWQDSSSSEGLKSNTTYTVDALNNNKASINSKAVVQLNKAMQVQGMDMTANINTIISSKVLVDTNTNIQKENNTVTNVTGTVDVMGQSIPLTSKITTVTKVSRL